MDLTSNSAPVCRRAFAAMMAAAGALACDWTRPAEVFVPDDDVISIAVMIGAGFDVASLLATYPHRGEESDPPIVDAALSNGDWTASFAQDSNSSTPEALLRCNFRYNERAWRSKKPVSCLQARLPEPVRVGERYSLSGTTALGKFSGTAVVPKPPTILAPNGPVVVEPAADTFGLELRYDVPDGVGFVSTEAVKVVQVVVDSTGSAVEEPRTVKFIHPLELDPESERVHATVWGGHGHHLWHPPEFRFDLHLVGFDENYSRFAALRYDNLVIKPWPGFGLVGDEGIYGYFGAASRSNPLSVIVRPKAN